MTDKQIKRTEKRTWKLTHTYKGLAQKSGQRMDYLINDAIINDKGVMELEYCHFSSPNEIMDLGTSVVVNIPKM